jgi:acyl-coenzyme A thioesterase PaaI-like protein
MSNETKNIPADSAEIFSLLKKIFEEHMPFDRLLGIQVEIIGFDDVCVRVDMKREFVGNFVKGILHGGVISSVLDLTGALIAYVGVIKRMPEQSLDEILYRFERLGTIDLRVDFLRAGKGKYFLTRGSILRIGNKVAVVRTEFKNNESVLIAAGTGTYLVE